MTGEPSDVAEDCGCAPTPRERSVLWPVMSRRGALAIGAVSLLALGAAAAPLLPAFAADYPSWDDVQAAKANEAAKADEVAKIQDLITSLQNEVVRTRGVAEQKSLEFYDAQQAYFDAAYRADQLQQQADAQAAKAVDAANEAGRVAAQLYRNGGDDTSMQLFFAGSAATADDLLARLGTMDKLLERNQTVYAAAVTARDSAKSLSDQAAVQRTERDRLQQVAQAAMIAAQEAAEAAQAALDTQSAHLVDLQAQLQALQDTTAKTIADYQAGVEAERQRQAELARQAAEAAQAQAAAAQAAGLAGGAGAVGYSGWCRPSAGFESSGYGARASQCGPQGCSSSFHYGVDLADSCYSAIFAACSGTVVYAGYNGGYGNYIKIDHGDGTGSGYGHIAEGGIYVSRGQWVNAGDHIAAEGNTGRSFGCHLHFETYVDDYPVNPVGFMADRGVSV